MKRRELVQIVAGTAVAHSVVTVLGCGAQPKAPAEPKHDHEHHDHSGHEGHASGSFLTAEARELAEATASCVRTGETCLEHCLRLMAAGDTSLGACAKTVHQMLAICRATASLASMGSDYLRDVARICAAACAECARACEPHRGHHAECAACADSCKKAEAAALALG